MKKGTGYNKVLPKAGLNGFDWTLLQGSIFVLRLNFCAKNPPPSAIPETLPASLKNEPSKNEQQNETENKDRKSEYSDSRL